MTHITKRPFFSHYRGTGTGHVVHLHRGKLAHQGVGQAFWFRPLGTVLSVVPVDDRELPLVFRGRTADFQEAAVQGSVTYRFADPIKAARRLDFGLDPATGAAQGTPLDQVAGLLTELAQQHALSLLASRWPRPWPKARRPCAPGWPRACPATSGWPRPASRSSTPASSPYARRRKSSVRCEPPPAS
jgi:hypothetical protein